MLSDTLRRFAGELTSSDAAKRSSSSSFASESIETELERATDEDGGASFGRSDRARSSSSSLAKESVELESEFAGEGGAGGGNELDPTVLAYGGAVEPHRATLAHDSLSLNVRLEMLAGPPLHCEAALILACAPTLPQLLS